MLANAIRGLATEFGLTVPQGIGRLDELIVLVDADKGFPEKARQVFTGLFEQCLVLAASISAVNILRQSRRLYGCWPLKGAFSQPLESNCQN
jgi:error-prone DNA polymerase